MSQLRSDLKHFLIGALAQLARASALHVEGRGFDSHRLHKSNYMEYLVYESCDESTKLAISCMLIFGILSLIGFVTYYWFKGLLVKFKKHKK
jgi:hypothetical protein